jgi:hypothetical protein
MSDAGADPQRHAAEGQLVVKHAIKCGNSNQVYNAAPTAKDELAARRRTTPIHLGATQSPARGYRVLARLRDGSTALVVAADTRAEAAEVARKRAMEYAERAARFVLERWTGGDLVGTWVEIATRPGELPVLARSTGRRPLSGRARKVIEQWRA